MNNILKSVLVFLSFFVFYIVIYIPFIILNIDIENIPDSIFNVYQVCMEIIYIAILIYIYRGYFKKYIDDFKKNGLKHIKLGFNYWFIGLLAMIASNILISTMSPIAIPENEQAIRDIIKISPVFIVISSVITAPFIEEILFRQTLADIFKNKYLYILTSGLLFGSFHVIGIATSAYSWLYVIPYAALGVAFAYMYYKTNNLLTSISLHAFHNLITVIQILIIL